MPISKSAQVVIRTWYNFEYTAVCRVCRVRSRWIILFDTYTRIRPHEYPRARTAHGLSRRFSSGEVGARSRRTSPLVGKEEIIREGLACPLF